MGCGIWKIPNIYDWQFLIGRNKYVSRAMDNLRGVLLALCEAKQIEVVDYITIDIPRSWPTFASRIFAPSLMFAASVIEAVTVC